MAKKSITKSKSLATPKKYQTAGFNSANYNTVVNPYYVDEAFSQQQSRMANTYYNQALGYGRFAAQSNRMAEQARLQREEEQKAIIREAEAAKKQEEQTFATDASKKLIETGIEEAKKTAAKKAAEEAAKKAAIDATTAGASAAVAPLSSTAAAAQTAVPTLTTQAARGSGIESARLASNLIDETGAVTVTPAGQAANAATSVGGSTAKAGLLGSNMSGLASAGIGLGLSGAGMLVQRKMDTDPTKFDKKEGRQNIIGDALKSAGTGFSIGSAAGSAIPGIGNVVGGIVGGIGGAAIGAIKGAKENKEAKKAAKEFDIQQAKLAEEERSRKAILGEQARQIAQQYNTAFLNSRLTGLQTGFGYNTSTNMNMQPTSSFYGKTGGKLPGGHIVPIGDDAVKFIGPKHSEGGIKLDKHTEVEGGETMDKVMMSGGKPNDYFFSAYLKLGGKSFAKRHEELVKSGASQKEIQDLAKKQEAVANKKGEKHRGPEQIAKYGGIHKYQTGDFYGKNEDDTEETEAINLAAATLTPQQSANAQSNKDASNVTVRDQNKANAKAPSPQQSVAPDSKGGTTNAGQNAANTAAAVTNTTNNTTATNTSATGTPVAPGKERLFSREDITKGGKGVSKSMEKVPEGQGDKGTYFGNVSNAQFEAFKTNNPWFDFSAGFDPTKRDFTSAKGVKGSSDVARFQEEYNKYVGEGNKLQVDGKLGEQTATAMLMFTDPAAAPVVDAPAAATQPTTPTAQEKIKEEVIIANLKKGINGSLLAGLGQLIPVGYALARPYRTEGNLPRMQGTSNVGAGSVKGAILPRVNMNAERAASERATVAVTNAIRNQNAGPGSIAAMMAAGAKQSQELLAISNQEQRANRELAAEEARLGQQASMTNAEMAQRASIANAQNRLAAQQANLEAGIQEARLRIDEKRYKREEILGALDTAAARVAGIVKDEKSYKAQERLAKAIDATGSYDRFTIYEQLQKESKRKNSPYYGKTDAELKKIAANTHNYYVGKAGEEAETAKLGGARRYTSRLGDLNRGRNKRKFNI